jgi:hypothetical protein
MMSVTLQVNHPLLGALQSCEEGQELGSDALFFLCSHESCHTMHMCTHALSLLIRCCIVSSFKHAQMTSGNITIFATSSTYCDPSRLLLLAHGILQYLAVTYGNQSSWKSPQS